MPKIVVSNDKLTAIGDAIRAEKNSTQKMTLNQMNTELQMFADTSTGTISSKEVVSGYSAYSQDQKINGSITNYTGTYENGVSGSATPVEQATPKITVSTSGVITATNNQQGGYVKAGTKTATEYLKTYNATTLTPNTSNLTLSKNYYLTGDIAIKGDSNLTNANIMSGKTIFGKSGTYTGDATATTEDVMEGKTFYSKGQLLTGTRSKSMTSSNSYAYYSVIPTINGWDNCLFWKMTFLEETGESEQIIFFLYFQDGSYERVDFNTITYDFNYFIIKDKTATFFHKNEDFYNITTTKTCNKTITSIRVAVFFGSSTSDGMKITYWRD